MLYYLLFFFVSVGAKLLGALVMIYFLLPVERRCDRCDGETLPIRMGAVGRGVSRLLLGTLERRWCPRCGSDGLSRRRRRRASVAPVPSRTGAVRR